MVKNVFFVSMMTIIGIGSSLLNVVSAEPTDQLESIATVQAAQDPVEALLKLNSNGDMSEDALHPTANKSYQVAGVQYTPKRNIKAFEQTGGASWYGKGFHGRKTSSGERYDMYEMTAAHRTLPIPSYVKVTNLKNGKEVVVKINDRGPFHGKRIIDLSYAAAKELDFVNHGVAQVKVTQVFPDEQGQQPKLEEDEDIFVSLKQFEHFSDAQSYLMGLAKKTDMTIGERLHLVKEGSQYTVRLGPFDEEKEAKEAKASLLAKNS
ncbi:septal ring lytic transglycosylase RlpA family protein [Neisseria sp. Ec49-e6-T10]|uniref:septal ring lytic transglycosylase RlpA family protein n=1 Tax=Neisseria sp. Ec49-e6-T10 TaxID=3140744 RepID=UPI003EBC946E